MHIDHEILLGLTTTPASDWKHKCQEIKKFQIKKIALFPTFLNIEKRKELYALLNQSSIKEIPHVHLRSEDMENWEFEMFETRYKTQYYNIHQEDINSEILDPYRSKVFIENQYKNFDENVLDRYAGLCVDFSHLEDGRIRKNSYLNAMDDGILDRYPIGCCHVSAIRLNGFGILNRIFGVSHHTLKKLSEVDYVKKYAKYLPKYISLELENSFAEQLEVKDYLEKILRNDNQ